MINKDDLENKDFSLVLPELIGKIQAAASSFVNTSYMKEGFIPLNCFWLGFGTILNEVADDLTMIDEALNPPPDEATIS